MDALSSAKISPLATSKEDADAVGVVSKEWFVAFVNNNTEKECKKWLDRLGYKSYVPTQAEMRVMHNGKKKLVDRIVFKSIIFINCTEEERKGKVVNLPFIKRFMTNRAGSKDKFGRNPIAIIPDAQIKMLQFVLENAESEVTICSVPFRQGDKVRVICGSLTGVEGYVNKMAKDDTRIFILIDCLGYASVEMDKRFLKPIK